MQFFSLNQADFGAAIGGKQSTVSNWLGGLAQMPHSTKLAYQAVLGIRWQWWEEDGEMLLKKIEHAPEDLQAMIDLWPRLSESDRLRVLGYAEGMLAERNNVKK